MLFFAVAAALFAAAAAGLVLWRAARAPAAPSQPPEEAVYARQIAELDEQKAQGLLDEDGWRAARAEAGRRLLVAAKSAPSGNDQGSTRDRGIVAAAAFGAVALAGIVYLSVGEPGRRDEPFAARLAAWKKTPLGMLDAERRVAVLEPQLRARPNDLLLLGELGVAYAASNHLPQAESAFARVTELRPDAAPVWAALGEVRIDENQGRVGPDARAALERALKLDPQTPAALWWLGRDDVLAGRREEGLARWRSLLASLPADDPRRAEVSGAIAQAESGRSDQAQAVAGAPPEAQAAMIRGMVAGLAGRLERQGGTAAEWARLVRAYTVLGDAAARDRALAKARSLFSGRPQDLKLIEDAARPASAAP